MAGLAGIRAGDTLINGVYMPLQLVGQETLINGVYTPLQLVGQETH